MGFEEMMNTQKVLAAAAILAAAGTASAQEALVWSTNSDGSGIEVALDAANALGLNVTFISGNLQADFRAQLDAGGWEVVVIDNPTWGFEVDTYTALETYVDNGGAVHCSYWNADAEPSAGSIFGFGAVVDYATPKDKVDIGHPSWGSAGDVTADLSDPFYFDNGDDLTLTGSSQAGLETADGATATAVAGTTIYNAFDYSSHIELATMQSGVENQISSLLGGASARIVLYTEENERDIVAAADALGLNYDEVASQADLEAALGSGQYSFAIIDITGSGTSAALDTAIADFVADGNRAHFLYWNTDASATLQGAFGVASAVDYFAPREVFDNAGHPSWGSASSPIPLDGTDPWTDNGDSLTAASGAEIVSTFDSASGDGATVVANDNRTLLNGFDYDTKTTAEVQALLEAQLDWVRTAAPPPPPPGAQVVLFQSDNNFYLESAASAAGITPDLSLVRDFPGLTAALNNPDFGVALVSNPCCFFDGGTAAAAQDFVARGNTLHMSFWNLDADPVLQDTFGVASAVDFFDPRPVFDNASHPSWGSASSPVNVDPSPTPWFDNGDSLTAGTGTIVGTFDSTSGDGAIIVANGDSTLFNAFDYDSLDATGIVDLLTAQLEWLPSGSTCRADFDGDGQLTLFDFLAFQNAFDAGDLAADFDGDGILTLFDFLAFQNEFDAGCD